MSVLKGLTFRKVENCGIWFASPWLAFLNLVSMSHVNQIIEQG